MQKNDKDAQSLFVQALDKENRAIGAKIGYAAAASRAYQEYIQAAYNCEKVKSNRAWKDFEKYSFEMKQAPTPVAAKLLYGTFGYWLYNRVAYPVGKKNWGIIKRTGVKCMIPVWLFCKFLSSNIDLGEKRKIQQDLKNLQDKNSKLEAENVSLKKEKETSLLIVRSKIEKKSAEETVLKDNQELNSGPKATCSKLCGNTDETVAGPKNENFEAGKSLNFDNIENQSGLQTKQQVPWKKRLGWYELKARLRYS